jgi:hypothetical protein
MSLNVEQRFGRDNRREGRFAGVEQLSARARALDC